ncbi:hypothetical protein F183_A15750 [Bryobacterales bacterium F-183]|nr:hypothetical protein F183_A15750 [Bryobacterales bacterium F-183]
MLTLAFWYMTVQPATFRPEDLLKVAEADARQHARYRMEVALTCTGSGCPARPELSANVSTRVEEAKSASSN